ncbi:MAG: type II toxin-antitoxin system RatA family toxin, partial [Gammaproteobacteria bacterium]
MTAVHREALVPYRCEEMFALVDDVEAYPSFLPWCRGAEVLSRDEDEVRARLEVARGSFQKAFTTCNRRRPPKMIEMRLVEGPFRHLQGFWRFEPVGEGG